MWIVFIQDVHARYRTEAHQDVVGRFNERCMVGLIFSLARWRFLAPSEHSLFWSLFSDSFFHLHPAKTVLSLTISSTSCQFPATWQRSSPSPQRPRWRAYSRSFYSFIKTWHASLNTCCISCDQRLCQQASFYYFYRIETIIAANTLKPIIAQRYFCFCSFSVRLLQNVFMCFVMKMKWHLLASLLLICLYLFLPLQEDGLSPREQELKDLKESLQDTQPVGVLVDCCRTMDQVRTTCRVALFYTEFLIIVLKGCIFL